MNVRKVEKEDSQYTMYVREKVEQGLQAVIDGRVLTQAEVEQRVEQYLEK